jgi:V/A-type H+-transporting ATPase subunit E
MAQTSAADKVVGKVADEAREELLTSLKEGAQQAREWLATAEREATAEARRIIESATREEDTLKRRVIEGAELEARNRSLQLTESAVNRAFEMALQKLQRATATAPYERALKALAEEAVQMVGATDVVLAGNTRDAKVLGRIATQLAKDRKLKVDVEPQPLNTVGGVQVRSRDGSIIYDNTMEARLARLKPVLRKRAADLFTREG